MYVYTSVGIKDEINDPRRTFLGMFWNDIVVACEDGSLQGDEAFHERASLLT